MRAEIISWNPINTNTSSLHACVYIKPTLEILEFFNRSPNHKGVVMIGGTSSCYDNKNIFCYIEKSSDVPNTRDNFYNSTNLYVIVLNTLWYGFPEKKGYIEFKEGIVDDIINYVSGCKDIGTELNKIASKENKQEIKEGYKNIDEHNEHNEENDDNENIEHYSDIDHVNNDIKLRKNNGYLDKNILLLSGLAILLILIISLNN